LFVNSSAADRPSHNNGYAPNPHYPGSRDMMAKGLHVLGVYCDHEGQQPSHQRSLIEQSQPVPLAEAYTADGSNYCHGDSGKRPPPRNGNGGIVHQMAAG
jgi:hypothetical protein